MSTNTTTTSTSTIITNNHNDNTNAPHLHSILLALVPKGPALLSIFSSSLILRKILSSPTKRNNIFHRLMLGLSISDIVSSTIYFLGTWLIPRNTPAKGFPGLVYGAAGNTSTCNLSGFFTQAAISGPLYNATLSMYYLLTIYYHWPDSKLKRVQHWFHIIPIAWSILTSVLALALDMYGNVDWLCWILPQEEGDDEANNNDDPQRTWTSAQRHFVIFQWVFLFVPLWCCIFFVSAVMFVLWKKMKENEVKMEKYRFRAGAGSSGISMGGTSSKTNIGTGSTSSTKLSRRVSDCSYGSGISNKDVSDVDMETNVNVVEVNAKKNDVFPTTNHHDPVSATNTTVSSSSFTAKASSWRDLKRSGCIMVQNHHPHLLPSSSTALTSFTGTDSATDFGTSTSTTTDTATMGMTTMTPPSKTIPRPIKRLSNHSVLSSSSSRTNISMDQNPNDVDHWKRLRKSGIVLIQNKSLEDKDVVDHHKRESVTSSSFPIPGIPDVHAEKEDLEEGTMDLLEFLSSSHTISNPTFSANAQNIEGQKSDGDDCNQDHYGNNDNNNDVDDAPEENVKVEVDRGEEDPSFDVEQNQEPHHDPLAITKPSLPPRSSLLRKMAQGISNVSHRNSNKLPRRASTNSISSTLALSNRKKLYHKASRSRQIAVQGMLYVCAFYITWLFPTIQRLMELAGKNHKYFIVQFLDSTLLPLQGFFNFIIYIRPRLGAYRKANKGIGFWRSFWNVVWEC